VFDLSSMFSESQNLNTPVMLVVVISVLHRMVFGFLALIPGRTGKRALAVLRLLTRKRPRSSG
jgi:hypothetical protein